MNIAEKLKELRENKGITQTELIKEIEKTQNISIAISSIKNYENVNNPRIPQGDILLALARYYDVSIESLLDDTLDVHKNENLNIGKELLLNDVTINNIKFLNSLNLTNAFNDFCTSDIIIKFIDYLNTYKLLDFFTYNLYCINQLPLSSSFFDELVDIADDERYTLPNINFEQNIKQYLSDKDEKEYFEKYHYDIKEIVNNKEKRNIVFSEYLETLKKINQDKARFTLFVSSSMLGNNEFNKYKKILNDLINSDNKDKDIENKIKSVVLFFNQLYYSVLTTKDVLEVKINRLLTTYMLGGY